MFHNCILKNVQQCKFDVFRLLNNLSLYLYIIFYHFVMKFTSYSTDFKCKNSGKICMINLFCLINFSPELAPNNSLLLHTIIICRDEDPDPYSEPGCFLSDPNPVLRLKQNPYPNPDFKIWSDPNLDPVFKTWSDRTGQISNPFKIEFSCSIY